MEIPQLPMEILQGCSYFEIRGRSLEQQYGLEDGYTHAFLISLAAQGNVVAWSIIVEHRQKALLQALVYTERRRLEMSRAESKMHIFKFTAAVMRCRKKRLHHRLLMKKARRLTMRLLQWNCYTNSLHAKRTEKRAKTEDQS